MSKYEPALDVDSPRVLHRPRDNQDNGLFHLHFGYDYEHDEQTRASMGYPHPFGTFDSGDHDWMGFDLPRALVELQMCAISNAIREKREWWVKMLNPEIMEKWRRDILEEVDIEEDRVTPEMMKYVLQELEGYAALRDPTTDIQPACFHRIWRSDALVDSALRDRLVAAVNLLEQSDSSTPGPDWHPGSDGKVLDLVHPSLYPIVYGQTRAWTHSSSHPRGKFVPLQPPAEPLQHSARAHISTQFCWLPSDFAIASDGNATRLVSPYVNNIDPSTEAGALLLPVVTSLVECAVPMWERVLSDLRAPAVPPVRIMQEEPGPGSNTFDHYIPCIWGTDGERPRAPDPDEAEGEPDEAEELRAERNEYEEDSDAWYESRIDKRNLPQVVESYDGALERTVKKTVDLKGCTLQVIVKLANIVLTPEKSEYGGGTWHVEGMENERIVSTFIYYYDEDNITKSSLAFRTGTNPPTYHDQDDSYCTRKIYGLSRNEPLVQPRGSVTTCQDRCIAFPNIYQHCVSPFTLTDPTRPGHRKIVALFLVDPTPSRRIPSATDVPPQQSHWPDSVTKQWYETVIPAAVFEEDSSLSAVDRYRVLGGENLMSREVAEDVRRRFMAERTMDGGEMMRSGGRTSSVFAMEFNMCEH